MSDTRRALRMTTGRSQYLADGGVQYVVDARGVVWGIPDERIESLCSLKGFEAVNLPVGAEPSPPLPPARRGIPIPTPSPVIVPAAAPAPVNVTLRDALAPIAPGARLEGIGAGLLQATLKAKGYDIPPDVVNEAVLETWARLTESDRAFEKIKAIEAAAKGTPAPKPAPALKAPEPSVTEALAAAAAGGPEPAPVGGTAPPTVPPTPAGPAPVEPEAPETESDDRGTSAWIAEREQEIAREPWDRLRERYAEVTGKPCPRGLTKADVIRALARADAREAGLEPKE